MFGLLSGLFGKIGLYLLLVVLGLFFFWMIVRGCKPEKVRPDPVTSLSVTHVTAGNRIEVDAGRRERKTRTVILHGIGVPSEDEDLAEQSRANLETLAGENIRVTIEEGRRRGKDDIVAEVFGEHGANCQIEQLRAGLAWVTDTTKKDYLAAEKEARKAKRGVWARKVRPGGQEKGEGRREKGEAAAAWERHKAACPECGADDPEVPLCVEGFRLLQEALKNDPDQ